LRHGIGTIDRLKRQLRDNDQLLVQLEVSKYDAEDIFNALMPGSNAAAAKPDTFHPLQIEQMMVNALFSQDLSMVESCDGRDKAKPQEQETQLKNEKYDEAVDISQSLDDRTNYGARMEISRVLGTTTKRSPTAEQ
jgi:hypothetical protein